MESLPVSFRRTKYLGPLGGDKSININYTTECVSLLKPGDKLAGHLDQGIKNVQDIELMSETNEYPFEVLDHKTVFN